jgi:mono/diheme cytochrome c family protein
MHTRRWIGIGLTLAAGFFLYACSTPNPQPPGLTPIPTLSAGQALTLVPALLTPGAPAASTGAPGDAAAGAAVYYQNCSPCHGVNGEGVTGLALRNDSYITKAGTQVFSTVANGRLALGMPAWLHANGGPLDEGQIANVVAYLHTLQDLPPLPVASRTPTPPPPTATPANGPTETPPEPARPSEPGDPGPAAQITGDAGRGQVLFGSYCAACHGPQGLQGIPNPGSDDGSVPALNPIDSTIVDQDLKAFATNIDLFLEHGSVPGGPAPWVRMPAFGDLKMLTDQQLADVIAYLIQLNQP